MFIKITKTLDKTKTHNEVNRNFEEQNFFYLISYELIQVSTPALLKRREGLSEKCGMINERLDGFVVLDGIRVLSETYTVVDFDQLVSYIDINP